MASKEQQAKWRESNKKYYNPAKRAIRFKIQQAKAAGFDNVKDYLDANKMYLGRALRMLDKCLIREQALVEENKKLRDIIKKEKIRKRPDRVYIKGEVFFEQFKEPRHFNNKLIKAKKQLKKLKEIIDERKRRTKV